MDTLTPWVCIARTGTFQDSKGKTHTFTEDDLESIRTAYDPAQSEAPLVFGHPKDNEPAYGWVQALKRDGSRLFARFAHVPDEVTKLVKDRRYRYVSMSLSPDKKRLLHVGLLGAAAPAIDGLGPVSLSVDGVIVNFTAEEPSAHAGDPMSDDALHQKIATLEHENKSLQEQLTAANTEKTKAEQQAAGISAEFAAFKETIVADAREKRVLGLIQSGKVKPYEKDHVLSLAAALAHTRDPIDFTAPDGTKEQISAEESYFRDLDMRVPDGRFLDFSAFAQPPAHTSTVTADFDPSDVVSKL